MAESYPLPGVKMKLLSKQMLDPMPSAEKIRYILDEVEAGKVLVLERGLTPMEEAQLIQATMQEIEPDRFTGIEMQSYGQDARGRFGWFKKVGRVQRTRMSVIGPANTLKTVSKDSHSIQALITPPAGTDAGA